MFAAIRYLALGPLWFCRLWPQNQLRVKRKKFAEFSAWPGASRPRGL